VNAGIGGNQVVGRPSIRRKSRFPDAEPTMGLGEQHGPAIGTDPPPVKGGGDLFAVDGWKAERQKLIVGCGAPRSRQRIGLSNRIVRQIKKLTLLPPPLIRRCHEYDGLSLPATERSVNITGSFRRAGRAAFLQGFPEPHR
jgi:hypothetical protein